MAPVIVDNTESEGGQVVMFGGEDSSDRRVSRPTA